MLELYGPAEVMKLYRLHSNNRTNKFQDISHISGGWSGKSGLGSMSRITDREGICGNKPLRCYICGNKHIPQQHMYNLTHDIDFAGAEMMQ